MPKVEGGFGTKPKITTSGAAPKALETTVLSEGSGKVVAAGELLFANYLGVIWGTNKEFDNSFDRGQPFSFTVGKGQVIAGWDKAVTGNKVGSRLLVSVPPADGYGSAGQPAASIKGTDTLTFVIDIVGSFGATQSADGTPTNASDAALPTVTAQPGAKPVIAIPAKPAPTALASQVLLKGSGAAVKAGQSIVVQYVGVVWDGGRQFDASWDRKAPISFPIGKGSVIKGWDEGLVGQTIGSRVLLAIPPDKGYGPNGNSGAGIKGTDTLVFVVDILGAF